MKFFFVALIVLAAFAAAEDDNSCGSYCKWRIEGSKLILEATSSYNAYTLNLDNEGLAPWYSQRDSITEIVVKGDDDGNPFYAVGKHSFMGLTKVTTATIEAERIYDKAFEGCTSLQTVTLTKTETIEKEVFKGCTSLTTITLPSTVHSIDDESFTSSSLATINVDSSNTNFVADNGVLYQKYSSTARLIRYPPAKADESFVIPNQVGELNVDTINKFAFKGCDKLKELTLPQSCDTVNDDSFIGCSALKEFKLAEGNTHFEVKDGVLISSNNLYRYPPAKQCTGVACTAYEIPDGVSTIKKNAFEGCSALQTLKILSASVHEIEDNAFDGCVGLTTFNVAPENTHFVVAVDGALLKIGYNKLESTLVKFPAKSTATEYNFAHPDGTSIKYISPNAFEGCTTLGKMNVPSNVSTIGERAFKGCTGLTEMNIPKEIYSLAEKAFEGCTGLTAINIEAGGTSSYKSVDGVFFSGRTLVKYPAKKAGASYAIPTEEATGLKIEKIGSLAFEGCALLTSVSVHKNVTGVEAEAFKDCPELVSVSFETTSNLGPADVFVNTPKLGKICVQEGYSYSGFGGREARDCSKPEPTPGPTPGPEPTPEPTGQSSSAAAVIPSLAAVVAVFAMFF